MESSAHPFRSVERSVQPDLRPWGSLSTGGSNFSPNMNLDVPIDKSAWRREMRRRWRESCVEDRGAATSALSARLAAWLAGRTGAILCYSPLPDEPDLRSLARELAGGGRLLVLPRVEGDGLKLHAWDGSDHSLQSGIFGILEPSPALCPQVAIELVETAIIPGLAFDPGTGIRLGRGAGYYDRLLAAPGWRADSVGLALPWQLAPGLPSEPHDRPMDWLATIDGVMRPLGEEPKMEVNP